MAVLTIPNTFVAGTPALASEVNANFAEIVSWSSGLDQDNMGTFTGDLAFTIANGNAIVIQNNGNDESIKITQGALLGANRASILITDSQTQTASGAAELKMVLASGATIPAIHVLHGATDTLKLTRDYLKPPVKTTVQRNAIVSPETGSLLYDSTTQQLNEKRSDGWSPVGPPVGSVQMFAGSSAPEGWLLCDGTTLDSVANPKYAALFTVISTTYGGTGAASFKVPDCRGVFVRGAGSQTIGAETYTATLGASQNDATAVNGLTVTAVGDHQHTTTNSGTAGGGYTNPALRLTWTSDSSFINTYTTSANGAHTHALTGNTETRPANIALNYIIKY